MYTNYEKFSCTNHGTIICMHHLQLFGFQLISNGNHINTSIIKCTWNEAQQNIKYTCGKFDNFRYNFEYTNDLLDYFLLAVAFPYKLPCRWQNLLHSKSITMDGVLVVIITMKYIYLYNNEMHEQLPWFKMIDDMAIWALIIVIENFIKWNVPLCVCHIHTHVYVWHGSFIHMIDNWLLPFSRIYKKLDEMIRWHHIF